MVAKSAPKKPRVGAHVEFDMGAYIGRGVIIEDRGLLGRDGERIWRVQVRSRRGAQELRADKAAADKPVRSEESSS